MADAEHADAIALLFSLLGGFFMGAYPVPIKARRVIKADPHPIVFQCYKTFWVFVSGWLFVLANILQRKPLVFEFTWWGVVSAAGWIPSGLSTIACVPRLGVGMGIAVSTGTASVLSFLTFWLVLGESMKVHAFAGHKICIAPFFLACVILGMVGMVLAPGTFQRVRARNSVQDVQQLTRWQAEESLQIAPVAAGVTPELKNSVVGLFFASSAGFFSAVQYGAVNLGKKAAEDADGCAGDSSKCSAVFTEQFNNFGSWMASFGIGALLVTSLYLVFFVLNTKLQGLPMPKFHFKVLCIPGSTAGLLWVLGNFFQTAAVVRGGNAVMLPANQAIQLVTSGAFGLLYYREVPSLRRAALWTVAALWTLAAIILLSREKAS